MFNRKQKKQKKVLAPFNIKAKIEQAEGFVKTGQELVENAEKLMLKALFLDQQVVINKASTHLAECEVSLQKAEEYHQELLKELLKNKNLI